MVAKKNLLGIKFGTLTVIHEAGSNKNGRALWRVRCDCGEERIVTGKDLGKKVTRCPRKCILTDDLTGKQIGNLLVLKQEGSDKNGFRQFRCRCMTPLKELEDDFNEDAASIQNGRCGVEILVNAVNLKQSLKNPERHKIPKSCFKCSRILAGKARKKQNSLQNLLGQTFGRLTTIRKVLRKTNTTKRVMYECVCACGSGKKTIVRYEALIGKAVRPIRSCGCLQKEHARQNKSNLIHGLTRHPVHVMWCGMKARCEQPDNPAYKWYGAKGVKIDEAWRQFTVFYDWAMTNGWQKGMSIDRIDSNDPYSPNNCRFLSRAENALKMQGSYGKGFFLEKRQININKLSKDSKVSRALCEKLLSSGYSTEDLVAYGKLHLHQKNAVGRSIHVGDPISISEAANKTRIALIKPPQSSEMGSYRAMMARCYNPKDSSYRNYGAKGIHVCPEWKNTPTQFLSDMGPKPEPKAKYALDRIDSSKDYCPGNCRWLHSSENTRRVTNQLISTEPSQQLLPVSVVSLIS